MNKLGTWTTIDCPTKKIDEALTYLKEQFAKIGGKVWKKINEHDFGPYPSFEIDYRENLNDVSEHDEESDENNKLLEEKDEWHDKANQIENDYFEKFEEYL